MVRLAVVIAALALSGCPLFEEIGTADAARRPSDAAEPVDGPRLADTPSDFPGIEDAADAPGGCEAPNVIQSPEFMWATPNTMRWSWSWLTEEPQIETLEVVVGGSVADVQARRDVTIFSRDEVAEFAMVSGPNRQSEASIWGLAPGTEYVVQFGAIHTDGCRSSLPPVTASTAPELTNEYVIFSEEPTDGYSIPAEFEHSSRNPGGGQYHYEWAVECDDEPSCFQIIRRQNLGDMVMIPEAAFDDAIIEFMALNEGTTYGEFWHTRMFIGTENDRTLWVVEYTAVLGPTAVWRLHQVPLRLFESEDGAMTVEDISGEELYEFGIGAVWDEGTYGNWDEVRIRW